MSSEAFFDFSGGISTWKKFIPEFGKLLKLIDSMEKRIVVLEAENNNLRSAPDLIRQLDDTVVDVQDNIKEIEGKQSGLESKMEEVVECLEKKMSSPPLQHGLQSAAVIEKEKTLIANTASPGTTWSSVVKKKLKVIRGTSKPSDDSGASVLSAALRVRHEPHSDFCVRGIPRVEDSQFANVKDYNAFLQSQLEKRGVKVRFVSVYLPQKGDRRGTTFARIGSFRSEKDKILAPEFWPSNVFVREWVF